MLFLAWMCLAVPASAQDDKSLENSATSIAIVENDRELAALHETYLAQDGLQLERPETEEPDPDLPDPIRLPNWLLAFLNGLGPILQMVFYIGAGIVVAMIAYFILTSVMGVRFGNILGRQKKDKDDMGGDEPAPSLRPDAVTAHTLLEEADALAREGKYAEAVHLLLFRSIEDIQTRRGQRLSTALTAREIGALKDLPARPREALGPIIAIVERSFFGGRPVDETGWQTARKSYADFAFGEAWT